MKFYLIEPTFPPQSFVPGTCYLRQNLHWNDWYKYQTLFELLIVDDQGVIHSAGNVKIGSIDMDVASGDIDSGKYRQTKLPPVFDTLPSSHFSLGQSENYYETLIQLGGRYREDILSALRDVAFNPNIGIDLSSLDVYNDSVRRDIDVSTIKGRYAELAGGRAQLTPYSFKFVHNGGEGYTPYSMDFEVVPGAIPPTNLHTIIGRNGVGKTHCLRSMVQSVTGGHASSMQFVSLADGVSFPFRRVVSVSFSAFDPFVPITEDDQRGSRIAYEYVGLKGPVVSPGGGSQPAIESDGIFESFVQAAHSCSQGARRSRWHNALEGLTTDPVFAESGIVNIAAPNNNPANFRPWFDRLSSGHKLILLTVTKLVAATEERTLILLDEPEAHLHPPLLASFVRCLCELLINRNAVAVVATHSPVVLQEVPSSCAHILSRTAGKVDVYRPELETFGESVGRLTAEVFGLEVVQSGFYRYIKQLASQYATYDEAIASVRGRLGSDGRALLRMHFLQRR